MLRRLSILLLICSAASGATWYGDLADGGTGSAGTTGDPFSFADMLNTGLAWSAGDTIWVRGSGGDLAVTSQAYGDAGDNQGEGKTIGGQTPEFA